MSKLLQDLDDTLNDTAKTLKETFEEFADTVTNALAKASGADVEASLTKVLGLYMGNKGFTRVPETTGITIPPHSNYDEPIIRNSGNQYKPISYEDAYSGLIANYNASDWTGYLQNAVDSIANQLERLNLITENNNAITAKEQARINSLLSNLVNGQDIMINYDNLINVNGSVDAAVIKDLEKLTDDIIKKMKKSLGDDLKKLGISRIQH